MYIYISEYLHTCIVSDLLQAWRIFLMLPVTSRGFIPRLTVHGRDSWARLRTGLSRRSDALSGTDGAAPTATTNYGTMGGAVMAILGWSRHCRKTSRSRASTGEGFMHACVHHMHNHIINKNIVLGVFPKLSRVITVTACLCPPNILGITLGAIPRAILMYQQIRDIHTYIYIYLYISTIHLSLVFRSLSLSLSLYIYIYIYLSLYTYTKQYHK